MRGDYDPLAFRGLERELSEIELTKAARAMERTAMNWALNGEKPSKYFLNLHKIRSKTRNITHLIADDGREISSNRDILQEESSFFKKIYSQEPPHPL